MTPSPDFQARALLEAWRAEGVLVGGQLYLSSGGIPLVSAAVGDAGNGRPLTDETLLPWLCCGKPVVAAALLAGLERHGLGASVPVGAVLPGLPATWDQVTVAHLLTHTVAYLDVGGKRTARRDPLTTRFYLSASTAVDLVLSAPWWAPPGDVAQYSPWANWLIASRLLEVLSGSDFVTVLRDAVLEPVGMEATYPGLGPGGAQALEAVNGTMIDLRRGRRLPLVGSEERRLQERPLPGSGLRGPASDLGRFAEQVLLGRGGPVLSPEAWAAMVAPRRIGLVDRAALVETEASDYSWGLGIMTDHRAFPGSSPGTVGHFGLQCTLFFADPLRKLVMVALLNGQTERLVNRRRRDQLASLISSVAGEPALPGGLDG